MDGRVYGSTSLGSSITVRSLTHKPKRLVRRSPVVETLVEQAKRLSVKRLIDSPHNSRIFLVSPPIIIPVTTHQPMTESARSTRVTRLLRAVCGMLME